MQKKGVERMGIKLFKHSEKAYISALSMLAETGKDSTGTGKSFIGFKLCETFPDKKLLAVPVGVHFRNAA